MLLPVPTPSSRLDEALPDEALLMSDTMRLSLMLDSSARFDSLHSGEEGGEKGLDGDVRRGDSPPPAGQLACTVSFTVTGLHLFIISVVIRLLLCRCWVSCRGKRCPRAELPTFPKPAGGEVDLWCFLQTLMHLSQGGCPVSC